MGNNCNHQSGTQNALPTLCAGAQVGCIPLVEGMPTYTPASDQIPFAIDVAAKVFWGYKCGGGWQSFDSSLCKLTPVDIGVLNNVCSMLKIPVTYSVAGTCVEGNITLDVLSQALLGCIPEMTTVTAGRGVTVDETAATRGGKVYTVNAANQKSVIVGGDGVAVTSETAADGTVTYTIVADRQMNINVVGGDGINVTHATNAGGQDVFTIVNTYPPFDLCSLSEACVCFDDNETRHNVQMPVIYDEGGVCKAGRRDIEDMLRAYLIPGANVTIGDDGNGRLVIGSRGVVAGDNITVVVNGDGNFEVSGPDPGAGPAGGVGPQGPKGDKGDKGDPGTGGGGTLPDPCTFIDGIQSIGLDGGGNNRLGPVLPSHQVMSRDAGGGNCRWRHALGSIPNSIATINQVLVLRGGMYTGGIGDDVLTGTGNTYDLSLVIPNSAEGNSIMRAEWLHLRLYVELDNGPTNGEGEAKLETVINGQKVDYIESSVGDGTGGQPHKGAGDVSHHKDIFVRPVRGTERNLDIKVNVLLNNGGYLWAFGLQYLGWSY